ncbi:hypothetical protein BCV70DRAFT_7349 [Testicularia cyperi]|uniref:WD40 repeat-like protein n=1 Tax=Testicularia cyperi TaxID=1882483 RepID=A0A317XX68_9BASI|nr:hypothetical protein BCV70DRAFT_7349 [Testicularia cyperi]
MDFTSAFRQASTRCLTFSPGSTFIASVTGDDASSIVVRASSTLQVIRTWTLDVSIQELEWSRDGAFILASHPAQQEDGVVFVLSLDPGKEANDGSDEGQGWVARIGAGSEGLSHATWTPPYGPRTLVMFSQNQVRASLYTLSDQTMAAIEGPKIERLIWSNKSPDRFATVLKGAERDHLAIFACKSLGIEDLKVFAVLPKSQEIWKSHGCFPLALNDAQDAIWSPDGTHIAVWEGLLEFKLQIYTPEGQLRATYLVEPESDGHPVTKKGSGSEQARSTAARAAASRSKKDTVELPHIVAGGGLGIREVKWSPSARHLVVGGWDEKLRILEAESWNEVCCYDTAAKSIYATTSSTDTSVYGPLIAWREPASWLEETRARGIVALEHASLPVTPAVLKIDVSRANARVGIKWSEWSPKGNVLAAFNERLPTSLFIYAFTGLDVKGELIKDLRQPYLLSVLQLNSLIRKACWKPGHVGKLGIVCGNQAVYTWELLGATSDTGPRFTARSEAIPIPTESFKATEIQWSLDGQKILLASDELFCCAFEV